MNEAHTWASQYEQLAAFTDTVNESVGIIIKQKLIHENPELTESESFQVADEQIDHARVIVAELLTSLVGDQTDQLVPKSSGGELPELLLDDYKERLQKNPRVQTRFSLLLNHLNTDEPVNESDKQCLDDLVLTLDSSRKQLFRKFRYRNEK